MCNVIPVSHASTLLDVGCGNGHFLSHFAERCNATGIDSSALMLSTNPSARTLLMQAEKMDFPDGAFDISFCHALLHHVHDPAAVLAEMKRVSSRYVVVLEPTRNNPLMFLFALFVKEERKALRFSAKYLKELAGQQHLKIIDIFAFGLMVPNKTPLWALHFFRFFERRIPGGITLILIAEKNDGHGEGN